MPGDRIDISQPTHTPTPPLPNFTPVLSASGIVPKSLRYVGPHLAVTPEATGYFEEYAKHEHAQLGVLQSLKNPSALVVFTTMSPNKELPFVNNGFSYAGHASGRRVSQSLVSIDPTLGTIARGGQTAAPIVGVVHEMQHALDRALTDLGHMLYPPLEEEHPVFLNGCEFRAVEAENACARRRGEGTRDRYLDGYIYCETKGFTSNAVRDPKVQELLARYRNDMVDDEASAWERLKTELQKTGKWIPRGSQHDALNDDRRETR